MSDEKERAHNQGQTDASEGRYSPPNSGLPFTSDKSAEDRSYRDGYHNTQGQLDRSSGSTSRAPSTTNPFGPSESEAADRAAYDKGRNS